MKKMMKNERYLWDIYGSYTPITMHQQTRCYYWKRIPRRGAQLNLKFFITGMKISIKKRKKSLYVALVKMTEVNLRGARCSCLGTVYETWLPSVCLSFTRCLSLFYLVVYFFTCQSIVYSIALFHARIIHPLIYLHYLNCVHAFYVRYLLYVYMSISFCLIYCHLDCLLTFLSFYRLVEKIENNWNITLNNTDLLHTGEKNS